MELWFFLQETSATHNENKIQVYLILKNTTIQKIINIIIR